MTAAVYHEIALDSDVCAAVWAVDVLADTDDWLVLPDGAIDVVLSEDAEPVVVGPATRPMIMSVRAGTRTVGVRLRPGAAPAALGESADDLRDETVNLRALIKGTVPLINSRSVVESLEAAAKRERLDPVARQAAALLTADPALPAGELARITSFSERQLLRRCERALGFGPKRYARIMRLQAFLAAARRRPDLSLSALAAEAGYTDQAHLAGDCRELAGRTPGALVGDRLAIAV